MARIGAARSGGAARRWPALAAAGLASLLTAPAAALEAAPADPGLEALFALSVSELMAVPITTAAKQEQPRWRSPSAVSVVSGEAIRRYGLRTLTDVLKTVVATNPGTDGGLTDHVGLRGASGLGTPNSHVLWLVDGHRVNDGFFQGALPGEPFPVDLSLVDRVEVIRGPGSALYGSNAFFGVVNVVTRSPKQAAGASVTLEAGGTLASPAPQVRSSDFSNPSDRGFVAAVGTDLGGVEALVSASYRGSDGRPIWIPWFDATGAGEVAGRMDASQAFKAFVDVRAGGWRFFGGAAHVTKGDPMASFAATPNSALNGGDVDRWFAEARHEWALAEGLKLSSRLYLDKSVVLRTWHYLGAWPLDVQDVRSGWAGLEERLAWRAGPNQLLVGAEFQYLRATQREHYPSEPDPVTAAPFRSEVGHTFTDYAVYASDELELGDHWFVTGGARLEGNDVDGAVVTGRAAVVYRPWAATVLKAQAGQGFLNTSPHLYGYHSSALNQFQWEIRPLEREQVTSLELVASQVLDPASLQVTLFQNWTRRLVSYDAVSDSYFNGPGMDTLGLEAELAVALAAKVSAYANWTWLRTEHLDGTPVLDAPPWSVKVGAVVRLLGEDWLAAAAEGQLYGPADYQDFPADRPGVDLRQPTYGVVNVNLTGRVPAARLAWSLGVQNLLNAAYGYPVTKGTSQPFPGAGLSWRASVELRY